MLTISFRSHALFSCLTTSRYLVLSPTKSPNKRFSISYQRPSLWFRSRKKCALTSLQHSPSCLLINGTSSIFKAALSGSLVSLFPSGCLSFSKNLKTTVFKVVLESLPPTTFKNYKNSSDHCQSIIWTQCWMKKRAKSLRSRVRSSVSPIPYNLPLPSTWWERFLSDPARFGHWKREWVSRELLHSLD